MLIWCTARVQPSIQELKGRECCPVSAKDASTRHWSEGLYSMSYLAFMYVLKQRVYDTSASVVFWIHNAHGLIHIDVMTMKIAICTVTVFRVVVRLELRSLRRLLW